MTDNKWFDILQQTLSKMHFSWKVTVVTFLMDNNCEDHISGLHWWFIVWLVLLCYCAVSVCHIKSIKHNLLIYFIFIIFV